MALAACLHAGNQGLAEIKPESFREMAINQSANDLRQQGIDPNAKKISVSKVLSGERYFKDRPGNAYWDRGRQAVANASFYMITFSEPAPSLGGSHQYFYHAQTHQLLWIARSK